ncbi:hypothetical protein JYK00_01465 [Thermosipho ferrireducens]|uniref:Uncharacterized protein n=1 Tax=Thermosipho ferrireducens TaxID=2571116 RepID=A0ABX7S970_9BACT|nr:hypothetical protein [Thermosipho ferrireducens]QTA38237.1 hypothetical protein JYK00_01465 [Thermosipho ferrireducens]
MKKASLIFVFLLTFFTGIIFADGQMMGSYTPQTPQKFQNIPLKNIKISDEATVVGTIKNILIEPGTLRRVTLTVETKEGDVEVIVRPIWKFFDFKPGLSVELNIREITINDETIKVAFGATIDNITVRIPIKVIRGFVREWMERFYYYKNYNNNLYDFPPCHPEPYGPYFMYNHPPFMMHRGW